MIRDEGYTKFRCDWQLGPAPDNSKIQGLNALRTKLFDAGLIGIYSDGIGFGNVSVRVHPARADSAATFIVSGTQTGALRELGPEHYCAVQAFDFAQNSVTCCGPIQASSESLTHAAVYRADRSVCCVVHLHSEDLWRSFKGKLRTTPDEIPYGTPAMALAIERALADTSSDRTPAIVMGGHREGLIFFAEAVEAVEREIAAVLQRRGITSLTRAAE